LLKAVEDFGGYIAANRDFIPDYGDRYRNEETITTAFVESAVKPGGEQALREKATDEVESEGSAFADASTNASIQ
jgi:hypothetical protein